MQSWVQRYVQFKWTEKTFCGLFFIFYLVLSAGTENTGPKGSLVDTRYLAASWKVPQSPRSFLQIALFSSEQLFKSPKNTSIKMIEKH